MTTVNGMTKALTIAKIAKDNGWKGNITFDKAIGETTLKAKRNDEGFIMVWEDTADFNSRFMYGKYRLFKRIYNMPQLEIMKKIIGWPDIIRVLKLNKGEGNAAELIKTYRRLPFDWQNDDNVTILNRLVDSKIWWYSRMDSGINSARVKPPKNKKSRFEIRNIDGRKLFNFIDTEVGMRSILLDTLLKVE